VEINTNWWCINCFSVYLIKSHVSVWRRMLLIYNRSTSKTCTPFLKRWNSWFLLSMFLLLNSCGWNPSFGTQYAFFQNVHSTQKAGMQKPCYMVCILQNSKLNTIKQTQTPNIGKDDCACTCHTLYFYYLYTNRKHKRCWFCC